MSIITLKQKGSSLIEVVVALFVLAIGMLGVMSMQVKSMQFSQSAYYYGQAVFLANDILEAMRSNPAFAHAYLIELDEPAPDASASCNSTSTSCSQAELRDWDLNEWRNNVESTLISGKSSVTNNGNFYTITVQFDDSRSEHASGTDTGASLSEYILVTEI